MNRKALVGVLACGVVGILAFTSSQFGKDLRMCYAVKSAADKFPGFEGTGNGVLVSDVRNGVVTLNASTSDPRVEHAISQGQPLQQLSSFNASVATLQEFERVIRWREGAKGVVWESSGWTNECGG